MSLLKQNIQEGNNAFNFVPPKLKIAKREKTIGNYITFTGIGLHSGKSKNDFTSGCKHRLCFQS